MTRVSFSLTLKCICDINLCRHELGSAASSQQALCRHELGSAASSQQACADASKGWTLIKFHRHTFFVLGLLYFTPQVSFHKKMPEKWCWMFRNGVFDHKSWSLSGNSCLAKLHFLIIHDVSMHLRVRDGREVKAKNHSCLTVVSHVFHGCFP